MTSSLPNLPVSPAPTGAGAANSASFTGLGDAGAAATGDFVDLMPETDAVVAMPATATAMPSFTILAPTSFMLIAPPSAGDAGEMPAIEPADETTTPATGGISRDTMEQAASLLAAIMQTLAPAAAAPANAAPSSANGAANAVGTPAVPHLLGRPSAAARSNGQPRPLQASPDNTTPDQSQLTDGATPAAAAARVPDPAVPSYTFEAALAADGTVEIKAGLPKGQGSENRAASSSAPLEIEAELALPGQAVLRLSATAPAADGISAKAKFAGKISLGKRASDSLPSVSERNFLSPEDKRVMAGSTSTGIAVAKTDTAMITAPTATVQASDPSSSLVARGEFTVAWPGAERTGEPTAAPVEKNFAERAVATVANLVDTQFTASMQKAGSVQLRLKFGGEDLSVRVELRGGAVHTDFRTDSPELRAALTREWQAVARQSPEQLRQFVEPVFAPSSSNGDPSPSFARQQQQAAQQDLPQQRQSRARDEDTLTFTRRPQAGETFLASAAAPRVPSLLPTSVRLSALA
jgi:hypothetical protein